MQSTGARFPSIDTFRGLVMLLLFGEVLQSCAVATALPGSVLWQLLCYQQSHAEWTGGHLHDLIQPGFTFLVGVSMPLSIAKRLARGDSHGQMMIHSARRAPILVVLGIAMLSVHPRTVLWKFEDTLTQIGLGYCFVFALALVRPLLWGMALEAILLGEWLAFAAYPAPGLLELFPCNAHYIAPKGLTTLNFIPTMATMILGIMAGQALARPGPAALPGSATLSSRARAAWRPGRSSNGRASARLISRCSTACR